MKTSMVVALLIVTLSPLVPARTAAAQTFDTFLLVPGINGSSTDDRHRNWIDVLSLSQALVPLETKKLSVTCNVGLAKNLDVAGPPLWAAAANGQVRPAVAPVVADRVEQHFRRSRGGHALDIEADRVDPAATHEQEEPRFHVGSN